MSAGHDYPALCRSLAAWLMGESKGEHRELKRGETADRLLEMAAFFTRSAVRAIEPQNLTLARERDEALAQRDYWKRTAESLTPSAKK